MDKKLENYSENLKNNAEKQDDEIKVESKMQVLLEEIDLENNIFQDDISMDSILDDLFDILEPEDIAPPEIKIEITKDRMAAFLNVKVQTSDQDVTSEEVIQRLEGEGIVYGINREMIRQFCDNRQFSRSIKAASGLHPTKGRDGKVNFYFKTQLSNAPLELADGTLDFKNISNIENVLKDALLCDLEEPTDGDDGMDIYGVIVPGLRGKQAIMPQGKNVVLSEDGKTLFAGVDGSISYKKNFILIEACLIVNDNVALKTGHIEYNGNVIVNGGVTEGFIVKATGDITIKGNAEGARIIAGGDIVLVSGINGMNKGTIKAEGDVTAKYIENVEIECGGILRTDVAINCVVRSKGAIIVKGAKGAILSGTYIANDYIYAKVIGSENRNSTQLTVQNLWYLKNEEGYEYAFDQRANTRDTNQAKKELENVEKLLESIKSIDGPFTNPSERAMALKKAILLKSQINKKIAELRSHVMAYEKGRDKSNIRIICPGTIHPGGKITLDRYSIRVENTIHNQKLYPENGEIVYGVILPHEKDIN